MTAHKSSQSVVSVIVPVWNGEDTIAGCLDSLQRQAFPAEKTQIIVVDNGSTDSTLEIVRRFDNVLLLSEPVPSSYRARNRGLAYATGDFIAFTDADCAAEPGWIEAGVKALQAQPNVGVAAGHVRLVPVPEGPSSRAAFLYEEMFAFRQQKSAQLGQSVTANWMSPRSIFKAVGEFDPELKSGGDLDLSGRIVNAGSTVRYVADMVVCHPTRGSISELVSKRRRVIGGMWSRNGQQGVIRLSFFVLVEAARRGVRALMAREYSVIDRLRVSFLLIGLAAIGIVELARLKMGGEPRRS